MEDIRLGFNRKSKRGLKRLKEKMTMADEALRLLAALTTEEVQLVIEGVASRCKQTSSSAGERSQSAFTNMFEILLRNEKLLREKEELESQLRTARSSRSATKTTENLRRILSTASVQLRNEAAALHQLERENNELRERVSSLEEENEVLRSLTVGEGPVTIPCTSARKDSDPIDEVMLKAQLQRVTRRCDETLEELTSVKQANAALALAAARQEQEHSKELDEMRIQYAAKLQSFRELYNQSLDGR